MSTELLTIVFLGLGGNLGNPLKTLQAAINDLKTHPKIKDLTTSRFFLTTPVSSIPQDLFINAVCRLSTSLGMREFFDLLQQIEKQYGKVPKAKHAPRPIDLDLLLFGCQKCDDVDLKVPHPEWKNRLFVLKPMLDITTEVDIPDRICSTAVFHIGEYLKTFSNPSCEIVHVLR